MKILVIVIAAAGILSGCVGYAVPYEQAPVSGSATIYLGSDDGHRQTRPHRNTRDRDRDGVPNRVDRDRDGDGVPNRHDNRPNNPNRY